jgi:hypothetical protein
LADGLQSTGSADTGSQRFRRVSGGEPAKACRSDRRDSCQYRDDAGVRRRRWPVRLYLGLAAGNNLNRSLAAKDLPGPDPSEGVALDAAAKDPKIKQLLTQTAVASEKELIAPLLDFHRNGSPIGNGWNSPPNGAEWDMTISPAPQRRNRICTRTSAGNRYIYTDFDSGGQRLTGAHAYTITFPAGQIPPVNGFWSLTLYNKEHFFEPNPLNRLLTWDEE